MFQESVLNMKTTAFSKLSQTNYWTPLVTFLEIKQVFTSICKTGSCIVLHAYQYKQITIITYIREIC